ncbi:MAG TPA: SPFH domain-containing protein, partial [Chitinophagaceae bacterium]|nr:SPFH domain-containing protein [Chitinophagaceae bacterium]
MFLLILSVIIIVASLALSRQEEPFKKIAKGVRIVGGILLLVGILSSCFVQIDAGFVGVKSLFGKVQNDVLNSGLNFVNPLVEVREMDIRTQTYTMSG